ncbi:hypothetical protein QQS21_011313 [Conoideocrella luteorostrata]|uniref:Carboxylesterase type B domain-containing protein n=1 Tax=Conoideocrella luteorostrata TaxID=1105319 RepID=A0AAJ0FW03_9HYPO|nr:hypothetical protein QQS21_011313 [Conoideocrella luteorostrata]
MLRYIIAFFVSSTAVSARSLPRLNSNDGGYQTRGKGLTVSTSSGIFAPHIPPSYPEIASFPDIRYAETPIGDLRFAPPVAAKAPLDSSVQYKTKLPAGCFQYVPPYLDNTAATEAGNGAAMFQRGDYSNTTEDCLRLSIFAPKWAVKHQTATATATAPRHGNGEASSRGSHNKTSLPVIIWIHGGGYSFGGTNVPYQLAQSWVQRSQRHIVVQVQYRLNLLGMPNSAGLAAQGQNLNVGLLDQRLAVEWVAKNIAFMGGDPTRITIWGESAGAYGVDGYLHAWKDDPIVSGVIADSGNALLVDTASTTAANYSQFSHVASRLGCTNTNAAAELDCMRQVPSLKLQSYLQASVGSGHGTGAADDGLSFAAVVDNVTVFSNYSRRLSHGGRDFASKVNLLIGTNTNEGAVVVPYNFNGSETATSLPKFLQPTAKTFKLGLQCSTLQEVRLRAAAGSHTWQYLYGGNFSDISPRPWLGAYHTAELPLIFGTYGTEGKATELEHRVSRNMQDLYLAFAENPASGLTQAGWPEARGSTEGWEIMKWAMDGKVSEIGGISELKNECLKNGYRV